MLGLGLAFIFYGAVTSTSTPEQVMCSFKLHAWLKNNVKCDNVPEVLPD